MVGGGYYEMTKKFWNDWQKRIGETYRIDLYNLIKVNNCWYGKWNLLSHTFADDKIIKATFRNNSVDLIIKQYRHTNGGNNLHSEILYITIDRTNIRSIEFSKIALKDTED